MESSTVLVVGAGQMGGGIAQVLAGSGRSVLLHDPLPGALERAFESIAESLARLAAKGGPDPAETCSPVSRRSTSSFRRR